MNVLSLFDGISCGRVALERAGIKVDTYYASEIDKYAIKITQKNYPDTIQLGDVNNIDFTQFIGKIDLLLGGSPCQDLSIAKQNRQGLKGERSKLFWKYVEALNIVKPKWFIFENVASMKKADKDIITKELGVEPIMIDSALVSAQQRKRLYWTNIPGIEQPEDKHIYLQDILESEYTDRLKSYCIDASYFKGTNLEQYLEKKRRQIVFEKPFKVGQFNSGGQGDRVYAIEGKSVTLSANGGGRGAKTGLYLIPVEYDRKNKIGKELEKAITLMASDWRGLNRNQKQNAVVCCVAQRGRYNDDGEIEQQYELRFDGKTNTLTTVQKDNMAWNIEEMYIRKLTPLECERLQTLPDNYTEGISNTQRYKCIGNGWTVDVIVHILKYIKY
jgi:DNA (cytosine-5)-methyltransferase 3A